ncbi:MAG: hypothetical protein C5S41_06415 [Candidatus Methanomarinus sp.]|nr:MAG: hypothetical protein C5S41_06415 [ANME-2 cluster archaeon]
MKNSGGYNSDERKILGIFEYFSLGFLATAGIMIVGIFGERTQKVK